MMLEYRRLKFLLLPSQMGFMNKASSIFCITNYSWVKHRPDGFPGCCPEVVYITNLSKYCVVIWTYSKLSRTNCHLRWNKGASLRLEIKLESVQELTISKKKTYTQSCASMFWDIESILLTRNYNQRRRVWKNTRKVMNRYSQKMSTINTGKCIAVIWQC